MLVGVRQSQSVKINGLVHQTPRKGQGGSFENVGKKLSARKHYNSEEGLTAVILREIENRAGAVLRDSSDHAKV